jgi:hypothetical protein
MNKSHPPDSREISQLATNYTIQRQQEYSLLLSEITDIFPL